MSRKTEILISTYTDPNGNERTIVFQNRGVRFSRKRQDRNTIETAKRAARNAFEEAPFEAEIVWWDGDLGRKHLVAEK
jgi:hypothetical protein